MKSIFVVALSVVLSIAVSGCSSDETQKAEAYLEEARNLTLEGSFASAKLYLDSIRIIYPKEYTVIKKGIAFMREVEKKEQERTLAFCDSMIPIKKEEALLLSKNFVFEKDSAYQKIGNYIPGQQVVEKNIGRSYIRSMTDEKGNMIIHSVYNGTHPIKHSQIQAGINGDTFSQTQMIQPNGSTNYSFSDLGRTTQVVVYKGAKENGISAFIYQYADQKIKIDYLGGKPYSFILEEKDKKALKETYNLSVLLTDITRLEKEKTLALAKIKYLDEKIAQAAMKEMNEDSEQ